MYGNSDFITHSPRGEKDRSFHPEHLGNPRAQFVRGGVLIMSLITQSYVQRSLSHSAGGASLSVRVEFVHLFYLSIRFVWCVIRSCEVDQRAHSSRKISLSANVSPN